jgi:hypothetical protein
VDPVDRTGHSDLTGTGTDMGDRLSGDGVPGRRHAHPDGPVPGPPRVTADGGLEALLAAAIRAGEVDPAGERRAVAAFSAARDAGALTARPRGRDDWRPRQARRSRRSLKVTLSVAVAGLTLGGVAYAGMGAGASGTHAGAHEGGATPAAGAGDDGAPGVPAGDVASSGSTRPDRPGTARDTEAHCRAYERVEDHGKALDATAWQRLVDAAGGPAKVEAYCADRLARAAQGQGTRTPGAARDTSPGAGPNSSANANANGGSSGNNGGNASGGAGGSGTSTGSAAGSGGTNGSSGGNGNGNGGQKATRTPAGQ